MPRQARLDVPGLLQHVMARAIERRAIFKDDKDRKALLEPLANILEEPQTQCYAWALIPNHFHLLLRTGPTPLCNVMRRLMTGYAVTFNKRHKRSGHLFQNRYKSVVCEEDPYLLELIRYIHLNPLRSGLVRDLKELDKYPWCGHSAILGRRKNPLIPEQSKTKPSSAAGGLSFSLSSGKGKKQQQNPDYPVKRACPVGAKHRTGVKNKSLAEKTIEDVLLHFGGILKVARRRYRQFVKNGADQGRRPEFQGGGLIRSAGRNKAGMLGRKKQERKMGDERILGSGDFVERVLQRADELEQRRTNNLTLDELFQKVSIEMGMESKELLSSSRNAKVSKARAIVSYLAVREMGYRGVEISRLLNLSGPGVSKCVERGKKIVDDDQSLRHKLISSVQKLWHGNSFVIFSLLIYKCFDYGIAEKFHVREWVSKKHVGAQGTFLRYINNI